MDKKVLIIVGVVVVIGAVLGLGVAGIIPIPGLSHPKAKVADKADDGDAKTDDGKTGSDAKTDDGKTATDAKADTAAKKDDPKKPGEKPADADAHTADDPKVDVKAQPDLAKGYKKLAGVWGEMKPEDLAGVIAAHYKPEDAAPILNLMDEEQVAAVFAAMVTKMKADGAKQGKLDDTAASADAYAKVALYHDALAKEVSKPVPAEVAKG